MMVASIETTLELWASSLREVKWRMRSLFPQAHVMRLMASDRRSFACSK